MRGARFTRERTRQRIIIVLVGIVYPALALVGAIVWHPSTPSAIGTFLLVGIAIPALVVFAQVINRDVTPRDADTGSSRWSRRAASAGGMTTGAGCRRGGGGRPSWRLRCW